MNLLRIWQSSRFSSVENISPGSIFKQFILVSREEGWTPPLRTTKNRVVFEVLTAVAMRCNLFWDTIPCSPLEIKRRYGGICRLHLHSRRKVKKETSVKPVLIATQFMLVSFLAYYFILKMETTYSSETTVDIQRTARHYISEDRTHHEICFNLNQTHMVWKER
jgi:hypothetical protein